MSIHLFIKKSVLCFFHLPLPPKTPKKAPEKKWRKTPPSPPSLTPNPPLPIPPWSPMPPNDLTPPRHRCLPHGLPCCPTPPRFQRTWQMFVSTQVGTPRFLGKKTQPPKTNKQPNPHLGKTNYNMSPRNFRGNGNNPLFNRKKIRRRRLPNKHHVFVVAWFVAMYSYSWERPKKQRWLWDSRIPIP